MKNFEFDINEFVSCCKQYGAEVRKGSGKILIDNAEVNIADIIEEKLAKAKEVMDLSPRFVINGCTSFSSYTGNNTSTVTFAA